MRLTIGKKLILGFLSLIVLMLIISIVAYINLKKVADSSDVILEQGVPLADVSMEAMVTLKSTQDIIKEYILTVDTEKLDSIQKEFEDLVIEFDMYINAIIYGSDSKEFETVDNGKAKEMWDKRGLKKVFKIDNKDLGRAVKEADEIHKNFIESAQKIMALHKKSLMQKEEKLDEGEKEERRLMEEMNKYGNQADIEMDEVEKLTGNNMDKAMKAGDDAVVQANLMIILISTLSIILGIFIGIFLSRSISRPVVAIAKAAEAIAIGDLEQKVTVKSKDEIGILAKSFEKMIESLKYKSNILDHIANGDLSLEVQQTSDKDVLGKSLIKMIESLKYKINILEYISEGDLSKEVQQFSDKDVLGKSLIKMNNSLNNLLSQVNTAVEQVAVGSEQVSTASQSLSQGATEQASSLEEITSSVGEINSQTIQNSDNANKANELANHAMENAKNGNEQMAELVKSMSTINKSAQEIQKIVKTIDDIAFQINLLALNANVEAARAGKYGKGFAVVADEVRNLAVRSTSSVKETTEMVEEATKNVEQGNKLVELTAKQLEEILSSSSKVAVLVEEIASASKEQTQGVEQVNVGLEQVDQVTQSATASAEECASTSEELASQAQQLRAMLQSFKLRETKEGMHIEDISPELLEAIKHKLIEEKKTIYPTIATHKVDLKKTQKVEIKKDNQKENQKKVIDPKDVISLEDTDFGKF